MENKIGEYVKNYRNKNKLSLRAFGTLCKMSHTHIDSIERGYDVRTGKKVNLTALTISKLASVMGLSEKELIFIGYGQKDDNCISDTQLKIALFGTDEVADSVLDEVKSFAQFIKARDKIGE